jgi:Domain of unknown function (DUF4055)
MATEPNDIEQHHPQYDYRANDWTQIEDGYEGERRVKARGEVYLPMTGGQVALGIGNGPDGKPKQGQQLYDAYKTRANYPSILKDTANALVGILNREPPVIELPDALKDMLELATDRGEPLEALLRRIQLHQLLYGRHGIMVDVDESRNLPYLVDFVAKRVINWDDVAIEGKAERKTMLVVLDETRLVRTGFRWESKKKFRALEIDDAGNYQVTIEDDGSRQPPIVPSIQGKTIDFIPFVFANAVDLVPDVGDVPLLGLSNLALTIYRGDADYRQALFMQGQDTLVITGEEIDPQNPDEKIIVGAGALISLPNENATAQFIGATSTGLSEMREAQQNDFERSTNYGLQMMSQGAGAEAAETLKIRVAARTADLVSVAQTSAAALTQALRYAATWIGADPDAVRVESNTDFIDEAMPAAELLGYMNAKSRGAPLSLKSIHALMRKGDVTQLTFEEEQEELDGEPEPEPIGGLGEPGEVDENGNPIEPVPGQEPGKPPAKKQVPGAKE